MLGSWNGKPQRETDSGPWVDGLYPQGRTASEQGAVLSAQLLGRECKADSLKEASEGLVQGTGVREQAAGTHWCSDWQLMARFSGRPQRVTMDQHPLEFKLREKRQLRFSRKTEVII